MLLLAPCGAVACLIVYEAAGYLGGGEGIENNFDIGIFSFLIFV